MKTKIINNYSHTVIIDDGKMVIKISMILLNVIEIVQ